MADCPKCGEPILSMNGEQIPIMAGGTQWRGVAYSCPSCNVVLGIVTDPIAIKTDIVDEILEHFRNDEGPEGTTVPLNRASQQ